MLKLRIKKRFTNLYKAMTEKKLLPMQLGNTNGAYPKEP